MQLNLDSTGRERGHCENFAFPVSGGGAIDICNYEGARFESHFHEAAELTLVLSGQMLYRANEETRRIVAGDAVFVNSNVIHAGFRDGDSHCIYRTFDFRPQLLAGFEGSLVGSRYVRPLSEDGLLPYAFFPAEKEECAPARSAIGAVFALCEEKRAGRELLMTAALYRLWFFLYQASLEKGPVPPDRGVATVRAAIAFMEAHYSEKLTLRDLSEASGLSRSELCRTFRRYTGRTPFEYLLHLRVRRALPYLESGNLSVTQIAEAVGFGGGSYFAEVFQRFYGCSPLSYRQRQLDSGKEKA